MSSLSSLWRADLLWNRPMTSDEPPELTDEFVMAQWARMAPVIDNVVRRIDDPDDFVVEPRSQLAGDDADSDPYQVSHCARACLNAGVDHLHTAKTLLIDMRLVHAAGDYSLIRGALENFATAFWVLHPPQRSVRVQHALRWMVKNFKDQDKATADLGLPNYRPVDDNVGTVVAIAERARCDTSKLRAGYASTPVLQYAEEHSTATESPRRVRTLHFF